MLNGLEEIYFPGLNFFPTPLLGTRYFLIIVNGIHSID